MINGNSPKNQAIKGKFVQREIVHCASAMIMELSKNGKYMDELYPILVQDDWKTPAKEHINDADDECSGKVNNPSSLSSVILIDNRHERRSSK